MKILPKGAWPLLEISSFLIVRMRCMSLSGKLQKVSAKSQKVIRKVGRMLEKDRRFIEKVRSCHSNERYGW